MHRFFAAILLVASAACATEAQTTDTGQLTGFEDRMFAGCQDVAGSASCGLRISIADGQLVAVPLYNDGTTGAAMATGTLTASAQAEIADLIAAIPMETPDTIGCGGAPLRATSFDVTFDHEGARHFDVQHASDGPMAAVDQYLTSLVTDIRNCSGSRVTFDGCTVNVPQ